MASAVVVAIPGMGSSVVAGVPFRLGCMSPCSTTVMMSLPVSLVHVGSSFRLLSALAVMLLMVAYLMYFASPVAFVTLIFIFAIMRTTTRSIVVLLWMVADWTLLMGMP